MCVYVSCVYSPTLFSISIYYRAAHTADRVRVGRVCAVVFVGLCAQRRERTVISLKQGASAMSALIHLVSFICSFGAGLRCEDGVQHAVFIFISK